MKYCQISSQNHLDLSTQFNLDEPAFKQLIGENPRPVVNIGCGEDLTIKELAHLIAEVVGYAGEIEWDRSKPDGTPRKLLDVSRLRRLSWRPSISLEEGILRTYEHYCKGQRAQGRG